MCKLIFNINITVEEIIDVRLIEIKCVVNILQESVSLIIKKVVTIIYVNIQIR